MERFWLNVERNIYDDSFKIILWSFSLTVADLLQLPPFRGKLAFSRFCDKDSTKHLLGLQLWNLFKYANLTEVVRQNDILFFDLLNIVRVGNIDDDDDEKLLKQDLYMNLMKTIQKMTCTCMQTLNLLWKGMILF